MNDTPARKRTRKAAPTKATQAGVPAEIDNKWRLEIPLTEEGKTQARMSADLVTRGDVLNAATAMRFSELDLGGVNLNEMAASLRETGAAVNGGDLSEVERMLHAQAVSLNAIFCDMARRAHTNVKVSYIEASERFMRLAFKAQSQCRATLETLAAVKNPPVVYAKQMNVANGPQQVNNGMAANSEKNGGPATRTPETQTPPNQLLEDSSHGSAQLDTRATTEAGRGHPELAAVGAIDRAPH